MAGGTPKAGPAEATEGGGDWPCSLWDLLPENGSLGGRTGSLEEAFQSPKWPQALMLALSVLSSTPSAEGPHVRRGMSPRSLS